MTSEVQFTEDLASRHDEARAPDGLLCATADGIVYTLHLKDAGHHLLLAGGACVPHWVREWRPSGLPGEWPNKLTGTIRYCHPHIAKGTEHAYSNDVVDTPLPVEPEQTPTAQPRSYRFDYKPGEWREPEQVVDESALASLEGKPATVEMEWVEVETVLTDCRVEFNPEGSSLPGPIGAIKVSAPFVTALPFPWLPWRPVALDWNPETGVAVITGPAGLFEPEHLTTGGRGTLGDEVLDVVEVLLTGDNREGAIAKVTAQRRDDHGEAEG